MASRRVDSDSEVKDALLPANSGLLLLSGKSDRRRLHGRRERAAEVSEMRIRLHCLISFPNPIPIPIHPHSTTGNPISS